MIRGDRQCPGQTRGLDGWSELGGRLRSGVVCIWSEENFLGFIE